MDNPSDSPFVQLITPHLYHCARLYHKVWTAEFKQDAADTGGSMCIRERNTYIKGKYIQEQRYRRELNKNKCGMYTDQELYNAIPHLWQKIEVRKF